VEHLPAIAASLLIATCAYAIKRWADQRFAPSSRDAELLTLLRHVEVSIARLERNRAIDAREIEALRNRIKQGAPWVAQRS